jgi:hypothetical protein
MTKFEREVILVVGKTGHGKTLWTRRYIFSRRRVIILDPMLEYEGILFDDTGKMLDFIEDQGQERGHGYYQVRSEWAEDAPDLATIAMAAGHCVKQGKPMPHPKCTDVCLVIDEAGRAIPSRTTLDPAIEDTIYRGRHKHVTLVNVTQRASTLSIAARSQWTRLITFWQTEDADIKWIHSQAGSKIPVEHLRPLEYFDITPIGIKKKMINVSPREDLHTTRVEDDQEVADSHSQDREKVESE